MLQELRASLGYVSSAGLASGGSDTSIVLQMIGLLCCWEMAAHLRAYVSQASGACSHACQESCRARMRARRWGVHTATLEGDGGSVRAAELCMLVGGACTSCHTTKLSTSEAGACTSRGGHQQCNEQVSMQQIMPVIRQFPYSLLHNVHICGSASAGPDLGSSP